MSLSAVYDIRPVRTISKGRSVHRFALFADDGTRVSGFYPSEQDAHEARRARIMRRVAQSRPVERPCMCCGHAFASEGQFHRLCHVCATGTPRAEW